jgi:predicted nucleic acid-binding protein
VLPELVIDEAVWSRARDLARRCSVAGLTVPATDLLIAACAERHGTRLEHADADFDAIARVSARGAAR